MKRWLLVLLLCLSASIMSMSRLLSAKMVKRQSHKKVCLNTPRNFGSTHFIIGYDNLAELPLQVKPLIQRDAVKPSIIDGSSSHLIDPSRQTQSFFTTIHDISSINIKLIEQAEKNIRVALFSLTDSRLANALISAHKKGVNVCVIVDLGKMKDRYSKANYLTDKGISVWYYDYSLRPDYNKREWIEPLMHHKCMIIDDIVVTGSANGTKASQIDNIENINILRDPLAVQEHHEEFNRLKNLCVKCQKKEKKDQQKKNQ